MGAALRHWGVAYCVFRPRKWSLPLWIHLSPSRSRDGARLAFSPASSSCSAGSRSASSPIASCSPRSAAPPTQEASAAISIPTIPAVPTDTVPAGQPTSTPRPVATPVPTVTPRPSDPAISVDAAKNTTPDQLRQEFDEFWQAFDLLEKGFYYRPLNEQQLVYGALKGMFSATGDDYTVFLPPDAAKDRKDSDNGQFVGIGVYIDTTTDDLRVSAPIPGGPAEAAGVKAGDVIVAIDGKDVASMAKADRTTPIRGPEGTPVRLTIRRAEHARHDRHHRHAAEGDHPGRDAGRDAERHRPHHRHRVQRLHQCATRRCPEAGAGSSTSRGSCSICATTAAAMSMARSNCSGASCRKIPSPCWRIVARPAAR